MTRVLLVDDDATVLARNSAALAAAGHDVELATTAVDALAAVRRASPDVIVLEGVLDGAFRGFDLARTLAADLPTVPLAMLTHADEMLTPQERADQDHDGGWLPVQRYLQKPVMPEVLVDVVEHLVPRPVATP